jgi:hypothetical protein
VQTVFTYRYWYLRDGKGRPVLLDDTVTSPHRLTLREAGRAGFGFLMQMAHLPGVGPNVLLAMDEEIRTAQGRTFLRYRLPPDADRLFWRGRPYTFPPAGRTMEAPGCIPPKNSRSVCKKVCKAQVLEEVCNGTKS